MTPILEARDLHFSYRDRVVFNKLSFAVNDGDMVALLGANGSGKTTLLSMAAGLLHPVSGNLRINQREWKSWSRRDLSQFVALVPQHLELPFSFSVEEIVAQGRVPHLGRFGALSPHDREIIEHAMREVDVLSLRDRVFTELSGGERQRVKIAIGLAQEPKLMLLDEPTLHLDIGRQIELVELLHRLNQRGITIVAAIHDLNVARENFDRAILLFDHDCIQGSAEEVVQPELLERAFSVDASALRAYFDQRPATPRGI